MCCLCRLLRIHDCGQCSVCCLCRLLRIYDCGQCSVCCLCRLLRIHDCGQCSVCCLCRLLRIYDYDCGQCSVCCLCRLLRLHDSGSMAYLLNRWFPSSSRCHGKQSPQQTFSLPTLQGPFYAAAAGLLLAAAVLGCERCGHRRGALKTLLADHVPACQANSRTD